VLDLAGIASLSVGTEHTCAVDLDGAVWCWGDNGRRQLGTGRHAEIVAPTKITPTPN
jgi:alpha-tubulin suppressor-like RCC1 family protein